MTIKARSLDRLIAIPHSTSHKEVFSFKQQKTRLGGFFVGDRESPLSHGCELQLLAFHEVVHAGLGQAEPLIGFTTEVGVIRIDFLPCRVGVVQVFVHLL